MRRTTGLRLIYSRVFNRLDMHTTYTLSGNFDVVKSSSLHTYDNMYIPNHIATTQTGHPAADLRSLVRYDVEEITNEVQKAQDARLL